MAINDSTVKVTGRCLRSSSVGRPLPRPAYALAAAVAKAHLQEHTVKWVQTYRDTEENRVDGCASR